MTDPLADIPTITRQRLLLNLEKAQLIQKVLIDAIQNATNDHLVALHSAYIMGDSLEVGRIIKAMAVERGNQLAEEEGE